MQIIDLNQAAYFLGYHPNSLRRLLRHTPELGIPYKRWGLGPRAHYRFVKEELESWVQKFKPIELDVRRLASQRSA